MSDIILVEDDDDDIYFFKAACQRLNAGINLTILRDGTELLDYIDHNYFLNKVILLDLNMPKLSGLNTLKKLQNNTYFKQMVIIMYTTSSREKDIYDAYNLGAKSYLLKPNSVNEIEKLVCALNNYWFGINTYSLETF